MKQSPSRTLLFCLGLMLTLGACSESTKVSDPEQFRRMVQLRERMKKELAAEYDLPVAAATEQQLKRGSELYHQVCAPCHGANGRGDGKTAKGLSGNLTDLTDPELATFYSEQGRLNIIKKGVEGTPMLSWQNVLTEADILAVYLHIRSLVKPN